MEPSRGRLSTALRVLADAVPGRRKRQGALLLVMVLIGGAAELLSIGALVGFLAVLAAPERLGSYPAVAGALKALGIGEAAEELLPVAAVFATAALLAGAARIAVQWAMSRYVHQIEYDLGVALYHRLLHRPYRDQIAHNSSKAVAAVTKADQIVVLIVGPVIQAIASIVISIIIFVTLVVIEPAATLTLIAALAGSYVAISYLFRRRLREASRQSAAAQNVRVQTVQEGLGGIRDVILFNAHDFFLRRFGSVQAQIAGANRVKALISGTPRLIIETAGLLLISLVAVVLAQRPGGLAAALPALGALALGAQRVLPLVQQIYFAWAKLTSNRKALFEVVDALQSRQAPQHGGGSRRRLPFEESIAFDRVSFAYAEGSPVVLKEASFTIPKGARVGFGGRTGSGKSTVMDLLMGLIEPTAGAVRIDGEPLGPATIAGWQDNIAHVPQSIFLTDASIAENIAFVGSGEEVDPARVEAAAARAGAADFIARLPEGYSTPVGERGISLSGGQRQRIGLARAFYRDAPLLVLDEFTSALDPETESRILASLTDAAGDSTVVIVSHRPAALRACDIVFEVGDGTVRQVSRAPDEARKLRLAEPGEQAGQR